MPIPGRTPESIKQRFTEKNYQTHQTAILFITRNKTQTQTSSHVINPTIQRFTIILKCSHIMILLQKI